jgi:transposase
MADRHRKADQVFREGAVRLVRETGKPIAQVARELGVNEGTLGNWANLDRRRRGAGNGHLGDDERAARARGTGLDPDARPHRPRPLLAPRKLRCRRRFAAALVLDQRHHWLTHLDFYSGEGGPK